MTAELPVYTKDTRPDYLFRFDQLSRKLMRDDATPTAIYRGITGKLQSLYRAEDFEPCAQSQDRKDAAYKKSRRLAWIADAPLRQRQKEEAERHAQLQEQEQRQREEEQRQERIRRRNDTAPDCPFKTLKSAYAAGWIDRRKVYYGGQETRLKGHELVKDPLTAFSATEWRRRGYRVRAGETPHGIVRSSCYGTEWKVWRADQVEQFTRRALDTVS